VSAAKRGKKGKARRDGKGKAGEVYTLSEEETFDLGRSVAARLDSGRLVLLEGTLGLGKTVFARGLAAGLGIEPDDVSSPTFTLVQEYFGGRLPMFHIDLYRIEDPAELGGLGLEEFLAGGAVVVIEWGERMPASYRRDALLIRFTDMGESTRRIEISLGEDESLPPADA
jgi:tRNA threonylcarbamoyladenosine biosynthesis protein TsaE